MELVHAERVSAPRALISLHDVSPLTLPECRQAVALLSELGLQPAQLTLLVIPRHEGERAIDEDTETLRFVRELGDAGATLVMHGLTHRMVGRVWSPAGWFRAHAFARGQGELFRCDARDTERRLDEGRAIFRRAGLAGALRGFVPPAWLLSPAARAVVDKAGFEFYELFDGIRHRDRRLVPRVIGWGSLSVVEARATAANAELQSWLPARDVRIAVHPADMLRGSQQRAVRRVLRRVLRGARAVSYEAYLAGVA